MVKDDILKPQNENLSGTGMRHLQRNWLINLAMWNFPVIQSIENYLKNKKTKIDIGVLTGTKKKGKGSEKVEDYKCSTTE